MLYQELLSRKKTLEEQIYKPNQKLALYPEGHLLCIKNGKYIKNIHVQDSKHTYIPKKDFAFVQKLAEKKYLSASLEDLKNEQTSIDSFLNHYQHHTSKVRQLMENPAYRKMISASLKPLSDELAAWADEPYERNPSHPEHLKHPCLSGHLVRSKSEVLIDQTLFTHQIPFRYECALKCNDLTLYPDFTIRHPETGQFFYWEHFGMMDSPTYSQNAFQKLQFYSSCGYIPTINLITTYETKEHPLTMETIENLVRQHFL